MNDILTPKRCFNGESYVRNNIEYRIITAECLSYFKISQSKILNELVFNKAQHEFSVTAKEILLLKYNVWSNFLQLLEQYLLQHWNDNDLKSQFLESINARNKCYEDTIEIHPDIFDQEYAQYWNKMHGYLYSYIVDSLDITSLPSSTYKQLCRKLVIVMRHTLYELYELDIAMFTNTDFVLSLDNLVLDVYNFNKINILSKRLDVYESIRSSKNLIVKNYLSEDETCYHLPVFKELQERGYKIILE